MTSPPAWVPEFSAIQELRRWIERRMEALPAKFKSAVGRGRLLLRAWRRRKNSPPYAVYWIQLNRKRWSPSRGTFTPPKFPFRRLRIRTRQDLDDAIWFGLVSKRRKKVYKFHKEARCLNSARASLSRAVERVRRIARPYSDRLAVAIPEVPAPFSGDLGRAYSLVRRLDRHLEETRFALHSLELKTRIRPNLPFRLIYELDRSHPYGRLRWLEVSTGRLVCTLTDRHKRARRIEPAFRPTLSHFERDRKRIYRDLKRAAKARGRISRILDKACPAAIWFLQWVYPMRPSVDSSGRPQLLPQADRPTHESSHDRHMTRL